MRHCSTFVPFVTALIVCTIADPVFSQDDRLSGQVSQMWHQAKEGVRDPARQDDKFGDALVWGDFNDDGMLDLAVGVPGEDVEGKKDAGAVNVFYGGPEILLTNSGVQIFSQGNNAIKGAAEDGDRFGAALAAGDLNGDGIDDLAIGVPGEDVGNVDDAGAVAVLFGTSTGILAVDNVLLYEGLESLYPGRSAGKDHEFGSALAIGDFFGYGNSRLAVGVPGAKVDGKAEAGLVALLVPDASGGFAWARTIHQGAGNVKGRPEPGDQFGAVLAVGDFDNSGNDDLAVGAPGESVDGAEQAGAVTVLFASQDGILESGFNLLMTQNSDGIEGGAESGDLFGWSLAVGDFDGDRHDDLAIGAPAEDIGDVKDAGAVNVLYGHKDMQRFGSTNQMWHQNAITSSQVQALSKPGKPAVGRVFKRPAGRKLGDRATKQLKPKLDVGVTAADAAESRDGFGTAVAAGDFDADGRDDLAIGVPREDAPDVNRLQGTGMSVGMVQVLYGAEGEGLKEARNQRFTQDTAGIEGGEESGDRFGMVLSGADLRLAIGVPGEAIGSRNNAGAVHVIYSGALK